VIKETPEIIDDYKWEMSRKSFLRSLFVLGAASQVPFLSGCETESQEDRTFNASPLSEEQLLVLQSVQLILFPKEGSGPSALEVNADKWVVYVLNDDREPQREKDFIINHLDGFIQFSFDNFQKPFHQLTSIQKEDLLSSFFEEDKAQKRWGSRLITLVFEALLLDPIYGVNPNEMGWNWLGHNPGVPRPTEENMYPAIYTTVNEI